jgi:site-specific DNA recombinase
MQTVRGAPAKPARAESEATKRAFVYLRVSSDAQVKTDYSVDGLSIDAQRSGASEKAMQLDADIVGEFSDPGRSAFVDLHKRTGFLAMLDELERRNQQAATRVDYIIVWSITRWARNVIDHWQARERIREAGARLISITEPMVGEDTAAGFAYESHLATNSQYQSMVTSESVSRGIRQKASVGGIIGVVPIGYLNGLDKTNGRRVTVAILDPDRHMFVRTAFTLYASGEYSLSQLAEELERLGLRSRPTPRYSSRPLGTSVVQRMLRNPFYTGVIAYKRGTPDEQVFPGRHEPLIDDETFERVQILLDEKRVAGERPKNRQHYLRGSVFCGKCGRRLTFSLSTGKSGKKYPYFFCSGRLSGGNCAQRVNMPPHLIEEAIGDYYRNVQLKAARIERAKRAIRELAAESQGALNAVRVAKTELIRRLTDRQDALIEMRFEEKSISAAVFKRKQAKLDDEIAAAEESLAQTDLRLQIDQARLTKALELAKDIQAVYLDAEDSIRRSLNQAFFKKLLIHAVWEDDQSTLTVRIQAAELTGPYALLLADDLIDNIEDELLAIRAQETKKNTSPGSKVLYQDSCSNFIRMAGEQGFEPRLDRPKRSVLPLHHSPVQWTLLRPL